MILRRMVATGWSGEAAPATETYGAVSDLSSPLRSPLSAVRYPRRRFLRLTGAGILAVAALPMLAACEGAIEKRFTVEMNDERSFDKQQGGGVGFVPSRLTIPRGSTVVWVNRGSYPHTATDDPSKAQNKTNALLPSGVAPWDSGDLYPGESWTRVFDVPGRYLYFDRYQESLGMIGTIAVTG